jgi:thiamine-phosphate pyrophosphorylase
VNDRADVARAAGADGVHLPEDGLPVGDARALVGPDALVGRSVHGPAAIASSAGADFVVFGPVFETASKRRFGPPQGLARLEEACAASSVPVLAIGGVTPERIADVLACGAAGVAVQGAILRAADPKSLVGALFRALVRAGAT